MKILWSGPVVDRNLCNTSSAISPAANNWQLDFINGLIDNNVPISIFSYLPNPSWPKGLFTPKHKKSNICNHYSVSYFNIHWLRNYIIAFKYIHLLKKHHKNGKKYDVLITYNASKQNLFFGKYFKDKYKGIWVSIIADEYTSGYPDIEVYLSYGYYLRSLSTFKMHLNGATPFFKECKIVKSSKKSLIYCGTIDKWTGIIKFIDDFVEINDDDFELHIYGKGNIIEAKNMNSKNIIYHGFVSENVLQEACMNAFAFVNPRPTNIPGIENNFPSKILFYLSFGKPIISTKTEGISPLFDNLLCYYNPIDTNDLIRVFEFLKLLNNEDDLYTIQDRSRDFCKQNTWQQQTELFLDFISNYNNKIHEREVY